MKTVKTVPEILRQSAAEIRKGWCKFALQTSTGVCAIGALNLVAEGNAHAWAREESNNLPARRALQNVLCKTKSIVNWNNEEAKNAEEVASRFEDAADLYEIEHAEGV